MKSLVSLAVAGLFALALAACEPSDLARNYERAKNAANVLLDVICALPDDNVVRVKIRKGFAELGLDSSRACAEGLGSLLETKAKP